ncbi:hypothetical protein [Oscillatoria sp. FACHB-1406]|uniref:hypothetical protein n=1 Tax=Oscillatoria sp. FACHB-1406 TaxID=2692846 RepID=UPI00168815FB|nr:hypothetical protein [Oscillatoria sp. FACHB-1406]MBD2576780.1 hypothetical protein [Oscillatoria sp. FACHB-1406]
MKQCHWQIFTPSKLPEGRSIARILPETFDASLRQRTHATVLKKTSVPTQMPSLHLVGSLCMVNIFHKRFTFNARAKTRLSMTHSTSKPKSLQFPLWGFPIAIALCLTTTNPASACKPAPDSRPAAIEQRISSAPYVFEGTIARVDGETLTIRVNRYLKGKGPQTVRLSGFNQTSCQDIISETGGRYLFFGDRDGRNNWTAVYDGAFGSSRPWNAELETELQRLGLLEKPTSPPTNPPSQTRRLPPDVANTIKQDAARRTGLPAASIQIVSAEFRTWPNACMGIETPDRVCAQVITEGWIVTARAGNQKLTYRTDTRGNIIQAEDSKPAENLPQAISDAVKSQASQLLNLPVDKIQITSSERQTWPNGCLGLNFPDRSCTEALVEGWRVTVRAGEKQLIYRTDSSGETLYLENGVSVLPASVRDAVLTAAARQTGLPRNQLRLTSAFPRVWDGCFGIYTEPNQVCTKIAISGWQVTVEGNNNRLVYHTNQNGSDTRLNPTISQISSNSSTLNSVPIPENELPQPLPANAVFRAISGGGITGDVREVILWKDGKITSQSTRGGTTQTRRVSPQQVREFEQILQQQRFGQYNKLAFPPPSGSADIISVTLSARQGTTRYADYDVEKLPSSLRTVVSAWQKLLDSSREQALGKPGSSPGSVVADRELASTDSNNSYPWLVERVLFQWLKPLF